MVSNRIIPALSRCHQRVLFSRAAAATTPQIPKNHRCFVSATAPSFEKHTIKVPTMGDSITEGTIVEWTASIGQAVKEDDVVALVETDKVTVEIKAEIDGVIMQHFGAVDDTVEVGAALYELDTEAEATVAASDNTPAPKAAEPEVQAPAAVVANAAPPTPAVKNESSHRTPSIKFLGKEGWARMLQGVPEPVVYAIPPNYGRPSFSEEEMEALMMGGANLTPDVKQHSSGAVFGY